MLHKILSQRTKAEMCWIVILEAEKAKGVVLTSSEGLCTVSSHSGSQMGKRGWVRERTK